MDARWIQKNGFNNYSYKNNTCIDVENRFIRRYDAAPANIHDRQMFPILPDLKNTDDYVWADSAYAGKCFEQLLSLVGFESCIHERGCRNHPLSDAAKDLNRVWSAIRACVENLFSCISIGGKLTRKIGVDRNEAWLGFKNLTFNFLRFLQFSVHVTVVA